MLMMMILFFKRLAYYNVILYMNKISYITDFKSLGIDILINI